MAETDDLLRRWSRIAPLEDEHWHSLIPGPAVLAVAARLSAVPTQFLDDKVGIRALAGDILGRPVARQLAALEVADDLRVRRGVAIGLWLFVSESVQAPFSPGLSTNNPALAIDALGLRLAPVVEPGQWLADAERREEAARMFLLWNGQVPAGETAGAARTALAARDSLQFTRVLADSFAEHLHRDALRRTLEDARAREAAARYTRE